MKISVVSGGFDPIHSGHIEYIKSAARYGEKLFICLNSDDWLIAKKGKAFMSFHERKTILESIKYVDLVLDFDDSDGSCIQGLQKILEKHPQDEIIFCNGGDRNEENIPEMSLPGIKLEFGVGGVTKINSSSNILNLWSFNSEERSWGSFNTIYTEPSLKIKRLNILPKNGLSFQRHLFRSEVWFIQEGSCCVFLQQENNTNINKHLLTKGDILKIPLLTKHQVINESDESCSIVEIQTGKEVNEKDIERFFYYPQTPQPTD